jgi:hypothetical protein
MMAGNWLENHLGLQETKEVNGQLLDMSDATTRKFAALETSMARFDSAVATATKNLSSVKGAGGSVEAARLDTMVTDTKNQINNLAKRRMAVLDHFKATGQFDSMGLSSAQLEGINLRTGNMSPSRDQKALMQKQTVLDDQRTTAIKQADKAFESIPKKLRDTLDRQAVTSALLNKEMANTTKKLQGKHWLGVVPADGNYVLPVKLDQGSVKDVLSSLGLNAFDVDQAFKGAKPPEQTVNITVQRVMAKDPNRWLADMEDMVAKRTRARTRSKRAWKVTTK